MRAMVNHSTAPMATKSSSMFHWPEMENSEPRARNHSSIESPRSFANTMSKITKMTNGSE